MAVEADAQHTAWQQFVLKLKSLVYVEDESVR